MEVVSRHTDKDLTTVIIKIVGNDEVFVDFSYLQCRDAMLSDKLKLLVTDENFGGSEHIIRFDSNSHPTL